MSICLGLISNNICREPGDYRVDLTIAYLPTAIDEMYDQLVTTELYFKHPSYNNFADNAVYTFTSLYRDELNP